MPLSRKRNRLRGGDLLRATQPVSCRSRCEAIAAQVSKHHLSLGTNIPYRPLKGESYRYRETLSFCPWSLFWGFRPTTSRMNSKVFSTIVSSPGALWLWLLPGGLLQTHLRGRCSQRPGLLRDRGSGQQYGGAAWPGEVLAAWHRVSWESLLGRPGPGEILGRKPQASLKAQRGLFKRLCSR